MTDTKENSWEQNLRQLLYQLDPYIKKLTRKLEKKHKMLKKEISIVFNQNCTNNNFAAEVCGSK